MDATTSWILWVISIIVTIITFLIPLIKSNKTNKLLEATVKGLKRSNLKLSEQIEKLSTQESLEIFKKEIQDELKILIERDNSLKEIKDKPRKKKSVAEAMGINTEQEVINQTEPWEFFVNWRNRDR